jgi:hypothetical protein
MATGGGQPDSDRRERWPFIPSLSSQAPTGWNGPVLILFGNSSVLGPKGQVVGWSVLSVVRPRHAFFRDLGASVRDRSGMIDLGDLCGGSEH